jgi:hypothetical protein
MLTCRAVFLVGQWPWSSTPMLQCANRAGLITDVSIIEQVLEDHVSELGRDFTAYRNHVYRVVTLCLAVAGESGVDLEKVAVAAVFHDLGIWTNHTFDYIAPSVALAREYLTLRGVGDRIPEIEAMIVTHHKITRPRACRTPLVESFRRADWIDVSRGLRRFGLPRPFIAEVAAAWPDAGFHRRLVELTIQRWRTHPLTPLPMVRW